MLDYQNVHVAPVFFLKATVKKQVWIPQFTKKNGQVVGGHYAMVHVADDHDHAKVAGGHGSNSQKLAHAALKDEPNFPGLSTEEQAALVMHHATQIQDAQSAAARLATLKKKLLAGEKPTPGEWKHYHAAPAEKQQAIMDAVHATGKGPLMDAEYAAWAAKQPPANVTPEEVAQDDAKAKAANEKAAAPAPKEEPKAEPAKPAADPYAGATTTSNQAKADYNAKKEAEGAPTFTDAHGAEYWVLNTGATNDKGEVYAHLASKVHGSFQKNGFNPAQSAHYVDPAAIKDPKADKAATAQASTGLAAPEFAEGKTTTGVKKYYDGLAQKIIGMAAAGDVAGLAAMPQPEKGSWGGKTANSKKLLELHAAAVQAAEKLDKKKHDEGFVAEAQGKPEAAPARADKFAEAKKDPHKELAAQLKAANWSVMIGSKGVLLASSPDYPKTYANQTQAANVASELYKDGFDAEVIGHHPYLVKIHGVVPGGKQAPAADDGPKEGDTKEGADGTLVLKDGHWVKQEQAPAAKPSLKGESSWSALKGVAFNDMEAAAKEWQAANPGQDADLSSTLVDMGYLTLAKKLGIYQPPGAAAEPAADPAHDAKVAAANAEPVDAKAAQQLIDAFESAKVPESNKNVKQDHKSINAIIAAVKAGDKAALLGMSFNTNTYGKKAAKLANEALAFLGSRAQVAPGQKAGAHPKYKVTAIKQAVGVAPVAAAAPEASPAVEKPAAAAPAPAGGAPMPPPLEGLSPSKVEALSHVIASVEKKDVAKLEIQAASMEGLAGFASIHKYVVDSIAHLQAADKGEALVSGWVAAIESGKAPSKEQADHMEALQTSNNDAYMDAYAEAHQGLAMHLGVDPEDDAAIDAAEKKLVDLHQQAKGNAKPKAAGPVGLDASEIPAPGHFADKAVMADGKQLAMAGDLGGLTALAQYHYDHDNAATFHDLNKLVSALTVKQKQQADAKAAPAAPAPAATTQVKGQLYHNTTDGHSKFWSVAAHGNKLITSYGKIGTKGQQTVKECHNAHAASLAASKLMAEKMKKGYALQGMTTLEVPNNPALDDPAADGEAGAAAEQGPKDGDTKQGADGMLIFQNGRWHKMGDDPKVLKKKAGSVPAPKFKGTNAIKMNKIAKALKAIAETEGADGLAKVITDVGTAKVKVEAGGHGFVLWKDGQTGSANGVALVTYAAKLQAAMAGTKGTSAPSGPIGAEATSSVGAAAPKAASASPAPTMGVSKTEKVGKVTAMVADKWEQTGPQKGSNPGGKFKDAKGQEWYCKFPSDPDTVKNELLAAKFYQMLGMDVPELRLVKKDGKLGIASKWVDGLKGGDHNALAKAEGAHKGFVFDAWLANWDVVGLSNDNLLLKDGKAVRVDVGGSLLYRAQGGAKGDAFGESVPELETLLDPAKNANSAAVFGKITPADLDAGGAVLAKMHPSQISKLCRTFGPGTRPEQEALAKKLVARREFILKKLGIADPWNAPPPDITKLPVNAADLPPPIDFNNYPGKGGGLSSKKHVNDQNTIDDAALISFAQQGNLKALQDYHYDAYDKETGAYIGKKPIAEHPSKDIKNHHAALCDMLMSIAHPPVEGLDLPPIGGGSIEEVSEAAGFIKPGETINTISADKVIGFWMKLGHVGADAVKDLMPEKKQSLTSDFVKKAKSWYQKASDATKHLVNEIQDSSAGNRFWSNGVKFIKLSMGWSSGAQTLASKVYQEAFEMNEGDTVGRWMTMDKTMRDQLLKEGAGLVFQNTDSMCASIYKNWGDNAKFGSGAFLNITYAKGAKAMASLGSGRFKEKQGDLQADGTYNWHGSGEMEVTTIMGQRFVVLGVKKGNASSADGITLDLLALPPHDGYVAALGEMATLGKALPAPETAAMRERVLIFVKPFAKK